MMKNNSKKISVYIIAFNEAKKIGPAIKSVQWADEVIVADSFSQDATPDIAESMGARVVQIPFKGFGALRNQAIRACTYDWVFSLDSDERCTPEAAQEILEVVQSEKAYDAYFIPRKNFFMGKWIRHSGFFPDYRQPQLFRKQVLEFKPDPVHEEYIIHAPHGTGYLKNAIWQIPYWNLEELLYKANRYSSLGAQKLDKKEKDACMSKALFHGMWAFIQMFFLRKGFLDGWPGFLIALGNFEGTFYKYAKLAEKKSLWRYPEGMV